MKDRIEKKISEYIESILSKDALVKEDYDVLAAELSRIKFEEQNKERCKALMEAFTKV